MHLAHPRLLVANFAETFRFYRDVMGFKVTWGHEGDSYASFAHREGKATTLALFHRQAMAEVVGYSGLPRDAVCQDRAMLIVTVEDVDATVERLQAQGVQFLADPQDFPDWGIRSAYLRDPDSNLIELYSDLPPARCSEGLLELACKYEGV